MDVDHLLQRLKTARLGRSIHAFASTDSTNQRALEALRGGGVEDGAIFVADRQTAGRGTAGRAWASDTDEGLWLSVVLTRPPRARPLPFLPAVALVDVLSGDYGIDAHVKWPNDVLAGRRKLAGVLIEARSTANGGTSWVIGIGVNVGQRCFPPPLDETATSMLLETGHAPAREDVLVRLVTAMDALDARGGSLNGDVLARSRMFDRWLTVRRGPETLRVRATGLDDDGHLLVRHEDGRSETWIARGEVEIGQDYV